MHTLYTHTHITHTHKVQLREVFDPCHSIPTTDARRIEIDGAIPKRVTNVCAVCVCVRVCLPAMQNGHKCWTEDATVDPEMRSHYEDPHSLSLSRSSAEGSRF